MTNYESFVHDFITGSQRIGIPLISYALKLSLHFFDHRSIVSVKEFIILKMNESGEELKIVDPGDFPENTTLIFGPIISHCVFWNWLVAETKKVRS